MKNRDLCLKALNAVYELQGVEEVTDASLDKELPKKWVADMGCDSLDTAEAVITLEQEFNVEISDEEVEALGEDFTIQQLLELAENKVQA